MDIKRNKASLPREKQSLMLLTVSDDESRFIYDARIRERFKGVDLVLSCGDLPNDYLDYITSMLNVPMLYVHGNHVITNGNDPQNTTLPPLGARNLHRQVVYLWEYDLIVAGIEGSLRYNKGRHQYTQLQMWLLVLSMVPKLWWNKLTRGRYLDVFMTHAPAWQLNDASDLAHQGIKAFRWLVEVFHPKVFVHGHIHTYRNMPLPPRIYQKTRIYNTCGYQFIEVKHEK